MRDQASVGLTSEEHTTSRLAHGLALVAGIGTLGASIWTVRIRHELPPPTTHTDREAFENPAWVVASGTE